MESDPDDTDLLDRARAAFKTDLGYAIRIAEAANKVEARRAQQKRVNETRAVKRESASD